MQSTHIKETDEYEVTHNNRVFRVKRQFDGEYKGLWTVKEQSLKDKGIDHWFKVGVEARKMDAFRMIEGEHYANGAWNTVIRAAQKAIDNAEKRACGE